MLSRFSNVRLCATPQTAAHQAPQSLGFSRQEHWSGLPFLSPMHASEKWKWSLSVMSDSGDPMDCSPPGSSIHGIFQARVLEWGAIAFSTHRARAPFKIFTIFLSVLIVDFPLSFKYCILSLLIWGKNNNILILSMSLHLHLLLPHNWWIIEGKVHPKALWIFSTMFICPLN